MKFLSTHSKKRNGFTLIEMSESKYTGSIMVKNE